MDKYEIKKNVYRAIRNIILEGCTDVSTFSRPFEIELLKNSELQDSIATSITENLLKIVNYNGKMELLKVKKISHMLVPKKNFYDFRKCALLEIIDEIKYLSIVLLIANEIEKKRLPKKIVFSYRFDNNTKNDRIFDKRYNYTSFKNRVKSLSIIKKHNIMIECDISNFYDRINLHRLNSTLLSIKSIDQKISNLIDELLLFWSNRDSYSIPVGSNASRILAEAFLIEIDNYLLSHNIIFCRFVDDYRFFVKNVSEANKVLSIFVTILNKHGLSINLSKTKFTDISEFIAKTDNHKKQKEGLSEIIRGYSGLVPTKFRKLSNREKMQLLEYDYSLLKKIKKEPIVDANDLKKCIRLIIAKEDYKMLEIIPAVLKKYPQFIQYFSDAVLKYKDFIDNSTHKKIIREFKTWLDDDDTLEYIIISIIRVFDAANEEEKKILFDYYKNLKRNTGIYVARTILEHIGSYLTRGEILELKEYYLRSDSFEKREIIFIVINGLSYQENRPFLKDLKMNCDDLFIIEMIDKYMKKNK